MLKLILTDQDGVVLATYEGDSAYIPLSACLAEYDAGPDVLAVRRIRLEEEDEKQRD